MQDNSEELTQIIQGLTETKSVKKKQNKQANKKTVKQIKYKTNYKIKRKLKRLLNSIKKSSMPKSKQCFEYRFSKLTQLLK